MVAAANLPIQSNTRSWTNKLGSQARGRGFAEPPVTTVYDKPSSGAPASNGWDIKQSKYNIL